MDRVVTRTTFWGAVISIVLGNAVGLWAISTNFGRDIADAINVAAARSCFNSQVFLSNYNSGINGVIPVLVQARQEYRDVGQGAKAATYTEAISRLEQARIPVPSDEQCLKPIIK